MGGNQHVVLKRSLRLPPPAQPPWLPRCRVSYSSGACMVHGAVGVRHNTVPVLRRMAAREVALW